MARFRVVQLLLAVVIVGSLCSLAFADPCPTITVDENGNGTLDFRCSARAAVPMPGVLAPDPGPGGLPAVLTYNLLGPPSLVAGDVLLTDADLGGAVLDVVRFNPAGTGGNPAYQASLVFYSDNAGGFDALGDTPSPPGAFYANTVRIAEVGTETNNGATYTPSSGQPGFVAGFNVSYNLISDAAVPEPNSIALFGGALLVLGSIVKNQSYRTARFTKRLSWPWRNSGDAGLRRMHPDLQRGSR